MTVAPRETRGIQWLPLIALGAAVAILPLGTDIGVPPLSLIAAAFASGAVGTQQLLRAFVLEFGIAHKQAGEIGAVVTHDQCVDARCARASL